MTRFILLTFLICLVDAFGEPEYVGNPDDSVDIERPCAVYDIRCIRKFFAEHGKCSIVSGPAPDPFRRSQSNLYLPRVNTSVILVNEQVIGLNGRIEEFFVNKNTGNLVIAIEFRPLILGSNSTYFVFHRRAKEPVVTVGLAQVFYESVVMTAVIPNKDNLQLDKAEVTVFSNVAEPPIVLGPGVFQSTDPMVQIALAEIVANLPTNIQELFFNDASFYAAAFIQYNICDFGLKVI